MRVFEIPRCYGGDDAGWRDSTRVVFLARTNTATDQEMQHVKNSLPEKIVVQRCQERLSDAFGPRNGRIGRVLETYVLDTEVFRDSIAGELLVESFCSFTNQLGWLASLKEDSFVL